MKYTKSGLSLLAVAGLAAGVIGMQMGGAGAGPACVTSPSGTGGTAHSSPSAGARPTTGPDNGSSPTDSNPTDSNSGGTGNGARGATGPAGRDGNDGTSGSNGSGSANGSPINVKIEKPNIPGAPALTLPTIPGIPSLPSAGSGSSGGSSDDTFLDLSGHSDTVDTTTGSSLPATGAHVTGHSQRLSGLLRIDGNLDTH